MGSCGGRLGLVLAIPCRRGRWVRARFLRVGQDDHHVWRGFALASGVVEGVSGVTEPEGVQSARRGERRRLANKNRRTIAVRLAAAPNHARTRSCQRRPGFVRTGTGRKAHGSRTGGVRAGDGRSGEQGRRLGGERTVEIHRSRATKKMGARNPPELVRMRMALDFPCLERLLIVRDTEDGPFRYASPCAS